MPMIDSTAERYETISYLQVLERGLKVMDATAIVMCRDNGIPLRVFNLMNEGDFLRIIEQPGAARALQVVAQRGDCAAVDAAEFVRLRFH